MSRKEAKNDLVEELNDKPTTSRSQPKIFCSLSNMQERKFYPKFELNFVTKYKWEVFG